MWQAFIPLIGQVLDKVFPDTTKAEEAKAKLLELSLSGEFQQMVGQLEINKAEAQNPNVFVSGWRPFIGWMCGIGLFYSFLGYPILQWVAVTMKPGFIPPILVTDNLMELVLAMLGLGGLRTFEKIKNVASK